MIGSKNSVFYLAALHMVVVSTYGKVLEIVNNKPQLKERRKIQFFPHFLFFLNIKFFMKLKVEKATTKWRFFFKL